MDVKSAFLYGKIEEKVYVCQPPRFEDPEFPHKVYKVYVDDIIFGSTKKELSTEFEKLMHDNQDKYVAEILKKFDFSLVKTASNPMDPNKALIKDEEAEDVDVYLYRSMIGSLMYLTASRPDITFAMYACATFQVTPKSSHLHAVKRIFRYLKGQPKLVLWYPRDSPFDLEAFSNSDYVGASLDRKYTTRGCQFLGKRLISWQCKKQTIVANSTIEAEYVAAINCCGQVLWIQNQMLDYGFNFMKTKIYIDNESTIYIVKNPVFHSKTKQIEIRHHFIRDSFDEEAYSVDQIHTGPKYETVHKEWGDRMERAATTASSLEVEQDSDAQTWFDTVSKKSNNPPLSRVNTLGSGEDSMKLKDLMALFVANTLDSGEVQITATIDGHVKLISKASIRRHLKLEDTDGITTLPNTEIFEQLAFISPKKIAWEQFSSNITIAIICLATNRVFNFSKMIFEAMVKNLDSRKDKGKAIIQESKPPNEIKKKEMMQICYDEELAQKLQAEELAKSTGRQEQEKYDFEKALELQRYHTIQNRSFSKAEVRKNMCVYLKNQGEYKQSYFKGMKYEDIRPILERVWDQNNSFVPKDSEIEKEVMKRSGFIQKQAIIVEVRLKRKASTAREDKDKRQKKQDDPEKHTLMEYVEVISDSEEIINVTPLAVKSPIVGWKSYCKEDVGYYEIHRVDGSLKTYIFFSQMLNVFDKEDLIGLYKLFSKKYASTRPGSDDLML
ncbi:hypothetical protein Tco_1483312 [Tanacetum coccineum]